MAELKIKADSGGGTVSFKGPATTTSNAAVQLTLPVDDGAADQYLKTDGSGALSWATVSSTPEGTAVKSTGEAATKFLRADGDNTCSWQIPDGKIKQVVSIRQTGQSANTSSSSYVALHTSPTITPSATSSKILVMWNAWVYCDNNNASVTRTDSQYQLTKNHTSISETVLFQSFFGNVFTENSGMDWIKYENQSIILVDEPSTTEAITYTINGKVGETGTSLYIADGSSSRAWTLIELAP